MVNPCCHPASPHYGKLQVASVIGGTLFTAGAITTALIPAVYTITALILPIALGVGALTAWVVFLALTINCCTYKPKAVKPVPIHTRSDPKSVVPVIQDHPKSVVTIEDHTLSKAFIEDCKTAKDKFLEAIKKEQNPSHYMLLEEAANTTFQATEECASGLTDQALLETIRSSFLAELKDFSLIAQALKDGKDEEPKVKSFTAFTHVHALYRRLKSEKLEPHHSSEFEFLLKQLGNINVSMNNIGDNPLMLLAKFGRPIEFIDVLVKYGADFNYRETLHGNTALIWAIANSNNAMALEIIHKGKQNLDLKDDGQGNTALILAIAKGYTTHNADGKQLSVSNVQLVEALLGYGANPNVKDNNDMSPLKMAVIRRNPQMIEALLVKGAIVDFEWKKLLELTYEQAFDLLRNQSHVCILDKTAFESSKETVFKLLSK